MIIVFATTQTELEAEHLAKKIVEAKLAACVQVLPKMKSFYFWEDEVKQEHEYLILIKTMKDKFSKLEEFILENHSYDLPEVVGVEAAKVSEKYIKWVTDYLG